MKFFNKIFFFFFLLFSYSISSQNSGYKTGVSNILNAANPEDIGIRTAVQVQEDKDDPLEYGYVNDKDILWSTTVWEIIDLDQRVNYPLLYPVDTSVVGDERRPMIWWLKQEIEKFNLPVYDAENTESEGEFIERLPDERVENIFKRRIISDEGREKFKNAIAVIEERISVQYDKYNFNPYEEEISAEEKQILANDSTFNPIFPYTIKKFTGYKELTDEVFSYAQFLGFTSPDGPVRVVQPQGIPEELSQDAINEYTAVLREILDTEFFVEDTDFYYKNFQFEELKQWLIKGIWYFDKKYSELIYRPIGIAPVATSLDEDGADGGGGGFGAMVDPRILEEPNGEDSDGDSIVDHIDICAKTPPNTEVDAFGCPVDDDVDGVPNSFDDELLTYEGVIVNNKGVTMTDDDFLLAFKIYKDSTGEYSEWDTILNKSYSGPLRSRITQEDRKKVEKPKPKKDLFIVIGSDVQGVTAEDLWEKLADRDFQVKESGDSIMYVLGGYNEQELSDKIKELEDNDVEVQGIVEIAENKEITPLREEKVDQIKNSPVQPAKEDNSNENMVPVIATNDNVPTFRVQIGAFNRKISKSVFKGIPNVVGIKGDDGLYRFFSGSYIDKSEAASHKVDLSLSGYNDAFLVAFQNGKRITLKEAGFEVNDNFKENIEISSNISSTPIDPEMVRFRVQVGAFKEKVPEDILANFKSLGSVMAITNAGQGYTKYYMGDFTEYKNVLKFRSKLAESGLIDCFIVGEFQKNIITSREALNLLGK